VNTAIFDFSGELRPFLALEHREGEFGLAFAGHQSVKHLIEALGVPHVEVGAVRADGIPVGMEYRPKNGDRIEVRAASPAPPPDPRFLLDNHLGRLAAFLRMLGFNCLYRNDFSDEQLVAILAQEERILLTRDRRLLMRKAVRCGYCPRSLDPHEQLREVMRRYCLAPLAHPFQRCLRCNEPLEKVDKTAVLDLLEPKTRLYYEKFARCPGCGQVYWQGSHFERMQRLIGEYVGGEKHG